MAQVIRLADAGALLWSARCWWRRRPAGATNTSESVRVWERLEFGLLVPRDIVEVARIVTSCRRAGVLLSACATRAAEEELKPWQCIHVAMDISCINFTGGSVPHLRFQDGSMSLRACGLAVPDGRPLSDACEHGHGQSNGCAEIGAVRALSL